MIINLKAILAGTVVIIVLGLLMQLLLVVTPFLYTWTVGGSILNVNNKAIIFLTVGLLGFSFALLSGGFVTGYVAQKSVYLNAAVAGGGSTGLSLLLSRNGGELTLFGISFFTAGVLLAMCGAFLWNCKNLKP